MSVESGYEPTEWESVPRPISQPTLPVQSVHYNSARHGSHVEESPELLRWRADLLMDEMMMGGVDVSAADGNRTFSGVDAPVVQRSQSSTNSGSNTSSNASDHGRSPRDSYERNPYEHGSRSNGGNANGNPNNGNHLIGAQDGAQGNGSYLPPETNGGMYSRPSPRNDLPTEPRNFDTHIGDGHTSDIPSDIPSDIQGRYVSNNLTNDPHLLGPNRTTSPNAHPNTGNSRSYDEPRRQPPTQPTPPTNGGYINNYDNGGYDNGASSYGFDDEIKGRGGSVSRQDVPRHSESNQPLPNQPGQRQNSEPSPDRSVNHPSTQPVGREDEPRFSRPVAEEPPAMQSRLRTAMDDFAMDGTPAVSGDQSSRIERLDSTEQQYEPFRREQNPPLQLGESIPPQMATRPPLPPVEQPSRQPTPKPRVTPQPIDEHTQWATVADKWEYQDFGSNPEAEEEEAPFLSAYPAPDRWQSQDSAVRNDPAQFVSAMSVMGSNKKRSTLLPRSSTLDVDTLHREISDLHREIAALLPVGNETGERARHLLDKAYSILQSDPMRSAEVEYYMQQVRTIVQRLYQARQWSDLYRQRLHVYLWGWLGLSAVMLIARFIFQPEIEEALMWLLGVDADNLLVAHWATFIGTAFAGTLGGAIGALYTMQTHARGEYSFFDRKYGLRGLILPFMGLIVGALGYLLFGLIFALLGIDPSQSLTVAIVPTMAAFAFGFSQESIYGTRS